MPYLVVVIDEYDELIRYSGKGIETFLESIARMGRATGIHLVISVQRPVASVISAGIKANMPSRISFRVTSANDSRNILGISGAERLQRPGEMIYTNGIEVFKSKCAYTDIQEIERINDYICNQQGYNISFELPDPDYVYEDPWPDVDMTHLDPLFEDAARLIVINQSASTSFIQRKFAIGYNRAGRLMAQLEKAGVVGAAMGSKPREVLIQDEFSLNNLLSSLR
jgi:S-DNA-T family DNA segregation ATPase FtsK/SpoIIIE